MGQNFRKFRECEAIREILPSRNSIFQNTARISDVIVGSRYALIPSAVRQRLVHCPRSVPALFIQCSGRNRNLFVYSSLES